MKADPSTPAVDTRVDVRLALRVFDKITRHGRRDGEDYFLDGIWANAGFDGYTISLRDRHVDVTIHFHNKYDVHYSDRRQWREFLDALQHIDRTDYA